MTAERLASPSIRPALDLSPSRCSMALRTIAESLIVLGTASLIYYKKITDHGVLTSHSITYRSDFVFFAAVIVGLIDWGYRLKRQRALRLTNVEQVVAVALGLYVLASLAASLHAYFVYNLPFDSKGLTNLGKTVLSCLLLVLTMLYLRTNARLFRWLAFALYVPPLLPAALGILFLLSRPAYQHLFGSLSLFGAYDWVRFQGLTSNPTQVAVSSFVAIAFLWALAVDGVLRARWIRTAFCLTAAGALAVVVFWSSSRSGVLAMVFVLAFVAAMLPRRAKQTKRIRPIVMVAVALLVLMAAWILLPSWFKHRFEARWTGGTERIQIWEYFSDLAVSNPMGLGFNYERRFDYPNPHQADVNTQNSLLAAWLYGGVIAVWATLLFLWASVRAILFELRGLERMAAPPLYVATIAGFTALWLSSLATGILFTDYTHAILAGMALTGMWTGREPKEPQTDKDTRECVHVTSSGADNEATLLIGNRFLALGLLSFVAALLFQGSWDIQHALPDARPLRLGEEQIASVFRGVIARNTQTGAPSDGNRTGAQVVFYVGGRLYDEDVDDGKGWRPIGSPNEKPFALPEGVIIAGSTFPTNAMRVVTDWSSGGRQTKISDGTVTLMGRHGVSATIHVDRDGRVWY